MIGTFLFAAFVLMLLGGVPIAVALGLAGTLAIAFGGQSIMAVPTNVYTGIAKYPLIAIPMFVLVGSVFDRTGVALRLVRFATALVFAAALLAIASVAAAAAPEPSKEQVAFFEEKVRPILAANCYKCHGTENQKGSLRLDLREMALAGGESGTAIVPGKPEESLLVEAINWQSFEMPPTGKLGDREIATLTEWIKLGAPMPKDHGSGSGVSESSRRIQSCRLPSSSTAAKTMLCPSGDRAGGPAKSPVS